MLTGSTMLPIGRALVYALLAIFVASNAASTTAEEVSGTAGNGSNAASSEVTRLRPVSNETALDSDVEELRRLLDDFFTVDDENESAAAPGARTFGHKRLQFMLMPMMYKMGVMMTMLVVLTVISLKGLLIGAVLLMLKLSTIVAKFSSGWHQPAPSHGWAPQQPIHVHVHNSPGHYAHHQAYGGWLPSGPGDDEHYYYRGRSESA